MPAGLGILVRAFQRAVFSLNSNFFGFGFSLRAKTMGISLIAEAIFGNIYFENMWQYIFKSNLLVQGLFLKEIKTRVFNKDSEAQIFLVVQAAQDYKYMKTNT